MKMPRKRKQLSMYMQDEGNVLVYNGYTKEEYLLGNDEYEVLCSLDGNTSIDDLKLKFRNINIELLIKLFGIIGFLDNNKKKQRNFKIKFNILNMEKIIKDKNIILEIICKYIIYVTIPLFVLSVIIAAQEILNFTSNDFESIMSKPLSTIIIIIISIMLHEFAHALVGKYYGAHVPEMGIMLYWFIPCGYTSIVGLSCIKSKLQRIYILLAGFLANLNIVGVCLLLTLVTNDYIHIFLLKASIVNIILVITNICVFMKTDFYYILEQLLNEKNLFDKAFEKLKKLISFTVKLQFVNYKKISVNNIFYILYAISTIVYIISYFIFLLIIIQQFLKRY